MTIEDTYLRQTDSWRKELKLIGKGLDAILNEFGTVDGFRLLVNHVADLRVRVQQVCRELNIYYDNDDTIASLIWKIEQHVQRT